MTNARVQLGKWMAARLDEHALFRRLSAGEAAADVAAGMLTSATEEGMKVARNEGQVREMLRWTACSQGALFACICTVGGA